MANDQAPKLRAEFLIERQGKSYALYQGLLDLAHASGLTSIITDIVQIPTPDNANTAIVRAVVMLGDRSFSGIGDASPANVGKMIVPHILRMAETRAKARALRDAVNVGVAAVEELGDADEHEAKPSGRTAPTSLAEMAVMAKPTVTETTYGKAAPLPGSVATMRTPERNQVAHVWAERVDKAAVLGIIAPTLPKAITTEEWKEHCRLLKAQIKEAEDAIEEVVV